MRERDRQRQRGELYRKGRKKIIDRNERYIERGIKKIRDRKTDTVIRLNRVEVNLGCFHNYLVSLNLQS